MAETMRAGHVEAPRAIAIASPSLLTRCARGALDRLSRIVFAVKGRNGRGEPTARTPCRCRPCRRIAASKRAAAGRTPSAGRVVPHVSSPRLTTGHPRSRVGVVTVYLTRPPKPVGAITDEERRQYAEQVWRAFTEANPRLAKDQD